MYCTPSLTRGSATDEDAGIVMENFLKKHVGFRVGVVMLALVTGLTLVGLVWLPSDPNRIGADRCAPPSWAHPMGTDWFGRDVLARVMVGGRQTLAVAGVAVALGGVIGIVLGGISGYLGGIWDEIGMRMADLLLAFPASLLALLLSVSLGTGMVGVTLAITFFNVPFFARIVRSGVLAIKEREYVLAAKALGTTEARILIRHILPNLASPILVQTTASFAGAMLSEAALSYLGLGTQPPNPAWGRMLYEAQSYFQLSPWPAIFPGLVLALAVLGLNLVGDALRDFLDPALRRVITR